MKRMTSTDLEILALQVSNFVAGCYFDPENMGLEMKPDDTPLTVADRGVHTLVEKFMNTHFPGTPVIGEEGQLGSRTGAPDEEWLLVDEVDGTWAYMLQVPVFTSLIAVMEGNRPRLSVIIDPIGKRLYLAKKNSRAHLVAHGGVLPSVKGLWVHAQLPKVPTVGFASWPKRGDPSDMLVPGMMQVVTGLHDMGCIPVSMVTIGYLDAMVAAGQLAGAIFPGGTMHDTAAGHLLVEEAGGKVTDLRGNPISYEGPRIFGHVMSMGGAFHDTLLELIAPAL